MVNKDVIFKSKYTEAARATATLSNPQLAISDRAMWAVFWGTSDKLQLLNFFNS